MASNISNSKKRHFRTNRAVLALESAVSRRLAVAEALEQRQLLSTSWFVSTVGSDQNPGTLALPFKTIEAAANIAKAGDHVEIETGVYRETITPANSGTASDPIVFEAYNGENVTVSGANVVGGWSLNSGNVYKASMPEDLGEGNNEVFVDGQAINEARFPNTSLDLSNPVFATADKVTINGSGSATIYDSALTQPANYWKGATIHMIPGQQWEAETGTVTASAPGQITISYAAISSYENPNAGTKYYLAGTFKDLNAAGEWYLDPATGTLYVWTPNSDNAANHDIEVKARDYAFNLNGKSYITINNVNIFAATIETNGNSGHTVLNGINVKYTSQYSSMSQGWVVPLNTGIMLEGANSLLENSSVAFSPGDGVMITGKGTRVTNTVIHDVDYNAGDSAGIRDYAAGTELDHNTIYNTGRDGILHMAAGVQILYNTVYNFGLQTTDSGGIYTVRTSGGGAVIAYNQVYNAHSGGYGETAIYLDNYSSNFVVHDNRSWNVDLGIKLNFTSENNSIYNNTFDASQHSVFGNFAGDWKGTAFSNNVLTMSPSYGSDAVVTGNVSAAASGKGAATFISGATAHTTGGSSSGGSSTGGSSGSSGGSTSTGTSGSGSTSTGSSGSGSTSTGSGTGSTSTGTGSSSGSTGTGNGSTSTGTGAGSTGTSGGSTSTGSTGGSTGTGSGSTTTTGSGSGSSGTGTGSGSTTTTGSSGTTSTGTATGSTTTGTGTTGTTTTGTGAESTSTGTGNSGTSSTGSGSTSTGTGSTSPGTGDGSTSPTGAGSSSTGTTTGSTPTGNDGTGNSTTTSAGDGSTSTSTTDGTGDTGTTAKNVGPGDGSSDDNAPTPPATATNPPVVSSEPPAQVSPPTVADLQQTVSDDRSAIRAAIAQDKSTIHSLAADQRKDQSALRAQRHQIAGANKSIRAVGSSPVWETTLSRLKSQIEQSNAVIAANRTALNAARRGKSTSAARTKLASDKHALKTARRAA